MGGPQGCLTPPKWFAVFQWKIIAHSLPCCHAELRKGPPDEPLLKEESLHSPAINSPLLQTEDSVVGISESGGVNNQQKTIQFSSGLQPVLMRSYSKHQRLYMPGKILHVVRTWNLDSKTGKKKSDPFYSAIWAGTKGFEEVLISPVMVHDHMPEGVIDALDKVHKKVLSKGLSIY